MKVDRHPKKVEGASDIVKLACGAFHNLALNACAPSSVPDIPDIDVGYNPTSVACPSATHPCCAFACCLG